MNWHYWKQIRRNHLNKERESPKRRVLNKRQDNGYYPEL
jgi:hypothetical protein